MKKSHSLACLLRKKFNIHPRGTLSVHEDVEGTELTSKFLVGSLIAPMRQKFDIFLATCVPSGGSTSINTFISHIKRQSMQLGSKRKLLFLAVD